MAFMYSSNLSLEKSLYFLLRMRDAMAEVEDVVATRARSKVNWLEAPSRELTEAKGRRQPVITRDDLRTLTHDQTSTSLV